jgi:ferredoxin
MSDVLRRLPVGSPGAVPAQISFAPLDRGDANVTRVPELLPAVISLGEHRPVDARTLTLDDLAVGCDRSRLYLVSLSQGCLLEPVLPHALDLRHRTPPLARFLVEIGRAQSAVVTAFPWGAAATLPYLPRVRHGRAVLSPARWLLGRSDLPDRRAPEVTMTTTYDPFHPKYFDEADLREEMTRVYDLCHGCRLCFKFCTAFPTLFDAVDQHDDQDAAKLTKAEQDQVVDECFNCKLCYVNCPYIPGQHEWELDFPRLMLRAQQVRHRNERLGGRDPVGEADPVRLVSVDDLAGHDQLLGVAEPDHRGQPRATAHVRQQPDPHLHDPGHGVLGHRAEVARQGQLECPAERRAVDLADGRLRHLLEQVPPGEDRPAVVAQPGRVLRQVAQVVQVHPRREHRPLAAQHHHAHLVVGGSRLDPGAQLADQLAAQRVALVGPVEDQVAHAAAVLCEQERHIGCPP